MTYVTSCCDERHHPEHGINLDFSGFSKSFAADCQRHAVMAPFIARNRELPPTLLVLRGLQIVGCIVAA
jgi:hypothetical protein